MSPLERENLMTIAWADNYCTSKIASTLWTAAAGALLSAPPPRSTFDEGARMSVETLPPAQLARLADGARSDLRRLQQRLSPPSAMLLELIQGSVVTQALSVA